MSEQERLPDELKNLYSRAEALAGRPITVEELKDGQYIALWLRFDRSPPKPGATEAEALRLFIEMMESSPAESLPDIATNETLATNAKPDLQI